LSFTVDSNTQITATVPAGTGTVGVTVTTPGGVSNSVVYAYGASPVLTSVNPSKGSASGGNQVNLNGAGLTGATAVFFGGTPATSFTVQNDGRIRATVPAGTGSVNVTATTPAGTSNSVIYSYGGAPALELLSPNSGSTVGGNTVTLTGNDFMGATTVLFGATPATSFTVDSNTRITAVAPSGSLGPVGVTVTTGDGTSNAITYTYI
ncbi:IPT/TIG domain-containing protein, partial [Nocardia sp. 004]|uniref:IPT/TIG domain-containing protein n=1 Tax=Nocardia sp. 004 TaxID=3385978 RepID=UPI0039A0F490